MLIFKLKIFANIGFVFLPDIILTYTITNIF